jgi:virginiamycin A acetyltransferase
LSESPLIRILGDVVGLLCALPVLLIHAVASLVIGKTRSFRATSEAVSLLPGPLGTVVRRAIYRALLARYGRGASIGFGTVLMYHEAELGDSVYVGRFLSN